MLAKHISDSPWGNVFKELLGFSGRWEESSTWASQSETDFSSNNILLCDLQELELQKKSVFEDKTFY